MSNPYYTHGSFPSTGAAATSASMRAELDLISAAFDKLPTLTSNANKFVVVNSTATGLTTTSTLPIASVNDSEFTFQDTADNTRKFQFVADAITPGATRLFTMPDADTTLVGTGTTQTLTNKTLTAPVIATIVNTGTLTLPTSTDTLVGRATTDTLTNKTLTNPTIGTILNTGTLTLPTSTDTLVGRATTDTLTNKTISGANNSLTNIGNSSLTNSAVTIGSSSLSLGGTLTTLAGVTISGASNTLSNIANASLTNSGVTFNGVTVALGASGTITASTTNALTIGTGLQLDTGTTFNGGAARTLSIDSTVATLSGSQTLSNKTISGSSNTLSNIANASLTNSSITIGSSSISLGSTASTISGLTSLSATGLIMTANAASSTAISAIAQSAGTVTVTAAGHGLTSGDLVSIDGVADYTYCGLVTVNVTNANVFTYSRVTTNSSSSGGYVTKLQGTWASYSSGTGPSYKGGPLLINASSQLPALRVTQGGNGYALIVEDAANPDTSAFIIANDGSLSINTNKFTVDAATGNTVIAGTLTLAGGINLNGNVTIGDAAADTLTVNSTITSNLIFTDNTYDIGASGATRPRNLYLAGNATIGGAQTLTGALTVDSTTDSSSTTTGSIQTDGGVGVAKALVVGTLGAFNNVSLDSNYGVSAGNGFKSIGNSKGLRLLNTNTDGGGTVYANSGAAAGITIGADAGPLVLQSGGVTTLTLSNAQVSTFAGNVIAPTMAVQPGTSSNTGPMSGLSLNSSGVTLGYYSPAITFDVGGGGGGAKLYTSRLSGAGGRFYINTDATNGSSYNRLLITETGEWYWYNNNVTTGAQAMQLVGSNLTVSGQIQSTLAYGLVSTALTSTTGIYLQVRPDSGKSGYLTFTENTVADRWAIGIQPGDGTLYFRNAQVTGTAVAKLSSAGQLTLGNVTQYSTSALTIPANAATSQPTFTIRDIDSLSADAYRGAGGNIQFRSVSSFANNGTQGTIFLAAKNYGSAPGSANDITEKVGLWIKGYYDNSGTPMPLYLGGYGYAGADYVLQIDQNRNLGVLIDPAPWAWPNGTAGALQLQSGAALSGYNAGTYLSNNWYYNAGEKYIANGYATRYTQSSGGHYFATAGNNSGGAGAGLTWYERFSSDANGVFRINSSTGSSTGNNLIIGNGNVSSGAVAIINTANNNYNGLLISNWYGAAATYGPRIAFDNSGRGGWTIGSSDGRNNFEISRSWGTPDFTVGSGGQSFFGGSYSYGGASAGTINLTGYGAPSIGFQAVANGALRAYLQHNVTGGGYGEMALYVGGDNNTNASQIGWYVTNSGKFLTKRSSSRSELGSNVGAQIADMPIISLSGGDYSPLDTGISVNQGSAGCTMLLMWSVNTSAGQNTGSAVYMIKFYYDGNYAPATTLIAGSNSVTFGVSGSNTLTVQGIGGNNSWLFIGNH